MVTNATPPGWYPDPWNRTSQRFWDGTQWTDHVAASSGPADRPRVADDVPIYGPLIWILALMPLLSGIAVWFVHIDLSSLDADSSDFNPLAIYGGAFWLTPVLGWIGIVVSIVLAYFDWKRLGRLGVQRPFHWAWAFAALGISIGVYVIGRSVIARRVAAPRGLAPVWVFIAAYLATIVSVIIWLVTWIGPFIQQLNELSNSVPTS